MDARRMPRSTPQVSKSQYSTCYLIKALLVGQPVSGSRRQPGCWRKLLVWSRKGLGLELGRGDGLVTHVGGLGSGVLSLGALLAGRAEGEEGVRTNP